MVHPLWYDDDDNSLSIGLFLVLFLEVGLLDQMVMLLSTMEQITLLKNSYASEVVLKGHDLLCKH